MCCSFIPWLDQSVVRLLGDQCFWVQLLISVPFGGNCSALRCLLPSVPFRFCSCVRLFASFTFIKQTLQMVCAEERRCIKRLVIETGLDWTGLFKVTLQKITLKLTLV